MLDKAFIEEQIQALATQAETFFANWQRTQGAKIAYEQILMRLVEDEKEVSLVVDKDG